MPTKNAKALIAWLEQHGYEYDRMNTKGFRIYAHPHHPEVSVNQSISDGIVKTVIRGLEKLHGIERAGGKRNATTAKERRAADRTRTREEEARKAGRLRQLNAEIDAKLAEAAEARRIRDAQLGGLGKNLTNREVDEVADRLEWRAARERGLQRLMTEIPTPNAHAGRTRAAHRA